MKSITAFSLLLVLASVVVAATPGEATSPAFREQWQGYVDKLGHEETFHQYNIAREHPELLTEYLFKTLAHGTLVVANSDPDNPDFVPYLNHLLNMGIPNPDTTYYYTNIDGRNTYRIIGNRGTVNFIEFQTGSGYHGIDGKWAQSLGENTMDDFAINKDGSFEILLSASRPDDYSGNWMRLDETADWLLVRQVAYGPHERNGQLAIILENKNSPQARSRRDKFDQILALAMGQTSLWLGSNEELARDNVINRFVHANWDENSIVVDQLYQHGLYQVDTEEALIVTAKVPAQCKYWNIQVADVLGQAFDYIHTQSSLNGYIDRSDSDGLTRFVLSHQDPGVANWIDLNDQRKGYMLLRWLKCDAVPKPETFKIAFEDVNKYLPADTKMVTLQERKEALEDRAIAAQLRRSW